MVAEPKEIIGWEAEKKNLFSGTETGTDKIDGYKAITRSDNGKVLSIMKDSYHPMLNSEFMDVAAKLQEISGFKIAGYTEFKEGRKVLGFLENNRDDFYIGGHKIKDYFLIGNSFDGSTSFFQGTSTILIRCQNQFSQIVKMSQIRHTKKFQSKLEELYTYLDLFFNQREQIYETFNRAGNVTLTPELRDSLIEFALGVTETTDKEISARKLAQMDILRNSILAETKDLGDNLFGAFNGVTKYTTHELVVKNPSFGNLYGTQGLINERAIEFVTKQLVLA